MESKKTKIIDMEAHLISLLASQLYSGANMTVEDSVRIALEMYDAAKAEIAERDQVS